LQKKLKHFGSFEIKQKERNLLNANQYSNLILFYDIAIFFDQPSL